MDLQEKINIFSKKTGEMLSFSVSEDGAVLCADGACFQNANDWMNGYWNNGGGSWDHNRWEDRW